MLDITKPLQTRDGRKAQVIYTGSDEPFIHVVLVDNSEPYTVDADGREDRCVDETKYDIVNI